MFYLSLGIHHRHLFCSDLVRQKVKIQQHDEGSASQQQHGWEDLDPRHFFPQLKEGRRPLDHHTQSHASNLERRPNTLHPQVKCRGRLRGDISNRSNLCISHSSATHSLMDCVTGWQNYSTHHFERSNCQYHYLCHFASCFNVCV